MKDKLTVLLFIITLYIFGILGILLPDKEISFSERRKLKTLPKYEIENTYVTKLDDYLLDQFPGRDNFRSIKAFFNYNILHESDNNKIYLKNNYIFKSNYPTNVDSINNFKKIITNTIEYFPDNNIFFVMIPDKNYYLNDKYFLSIDYDYIEKSLSNLPVTHIDIKDSLTLEYYYQTDTHWRQEKLSKVINQLNDKMNLPYLELMYKENIYDDFYGVYYGESAIKRESEQLIYLDNNIINSLNVTYLENKNLHTIYNPDKLDGMDPYDVYLDGASAFIEIENSAVDTDKELIVFRDSFGSSLIPLLTPYYHKITVIDNRYISSDNYLNMLSIENQDVLFLYSTLLINESYALKG